MADQFDPTKIAQGLGDQAKQQATEKVDSVIDELASKIPGGEQFAQQAKDAANQAIEGGVQQAEQAGEQQAQGGLGGIADKLGGMFGGGGSEGNQ